MMRMQLAYAGGASLALISGIPLISCHHSCIHQEGGGGGGRRAEAGYDDGELPALTAHFSSAWEKF